MLNRTKKFIFQLTKEFSFTGSNGILPPGKYSVTEDEVLIEGISWLTYRRIATYIEVPAIGSASMSSQILKIDHDELTAILQQDAAFEVEKTYPKQIISEGYQ